jgi:hypothetical protein
MLDKCAYCGQVYHPMPVYTRKPGAPADGYICRRDLTPTR